MTDFRTWQKEPGARVGGSRPLDSLKVQAPCIVKRPEGGYRLFYTAIGPAKPFASCQGYILSAVSENGLAFQVEPGIRVAPQPDVPHASLRALAPSVARLADGRWRMYYEARGTADRPTVIASAISSDQVNWTIEEGIRLQSPGGVSAPRIVPLSEGRSRLYCCRSEFGPGGPGKGERLSQCVVSAASHNGIDFEFEPGVRIKDRQGVLDSAGITAGEAIPSAQGQGWSMFYSAWQDIPAGGNAVLHPSHDANAVAKGTSDDFAAASIASDLSGYRSRILVATSPDGLAWSEDRCVIEGAGYGQEGIDAVHAEDMSLMPLEDGRLRMYYAACDSAGRWQIASAVTVD
jgi:hypothetical protein